MELEQESNSANDVEWAVYTTVRDNAFRQLYTRKIYGRQKAKAKRLTVNTSPQSTSANQKMRHKE